jgi:CO dehydrogenase maturation factor
VAARRPTLPVQAADSAVDQRRALVEQGRPFALGDLSPATTAALGVIQGKLDAQTRDWDKYSRQATEFHLRNARAWASAAAGEDLAAQVDPDFTLGPDLLALTAT